MKPTKTKKKRVVAKSPTIKQIARKIEGYPAAYEILECDLPSVLKTFTKRLEYYVGGNTSYKNLASILLSSIGIEHR